MWNVENVNFLVTRSRCAVFNADLSNWNVQNIVSFYRTFGGAASFKGEGLPSWHPVDASFVQAFLPTPQFRIVRSRDI